MYQKFWIQNVHNESRIDGFATEEEVINVAVALNEEVGYFKYQAVGLLEGAHYTPSKHALSLVVNQKLSRLALYSRSVKKANIK